jgi:FkbM family methyltransferase
MITINPTPLMTQFLVKEGVFRDEPFVIVDVGARGGLAPHWQVLQPCLQAYCFEPDEAECARLQTLADPGIKYIPKALAASPGKRTLYVAALADSSGLFKTNMDYFGRLVNADNGMAVSECEIDCTTLDELKIFPDFLKLDAEGGELDVIKGFMCGIGKSPPLGILSEIRFHPEINGSPSFSAFDLSMRFSGYRLFDLTYGYQSRKDLPYPQVKRSLAQDGRQFFGLTTRGQIQDGDALYFRDLLLPQDAPAIQKMTTLKILKAACLLEIYSLNDCAAELILTAGSRLVASKRFHLLDLLASGVAGESTTLPAYREKYFG